MNNNYRGYPMYRQTRQAERMQECECHKNEMSSFPTDFSLAMAYVPFQQWSQTYSADKALCAGTLFPCLDLPFTMGCCK